MFNFLITETRSKFIEIAFIVFFILLVIGGKGILDVSVSIFGLIISTQLLILFKLLFKRIVFPRYFRIYFVFLLFFFVSLSWSRDVFVSIRELILYLSGTVIWVFFYNVSFHFASNSSREKIQKYFVFLLILLGVAFVFLYLFPLDQEIYAFLNPFSYRVGGLIGHNQIGDLWAPIVVVVLYILSSGKKNIYWFLIFVLGLVLIYFSKSRTAIVTLFVGGYMIYSKYKFIPLKYLTPLLIFFFLIFGANKSLFLNRIYYLQALAGTQHNLFGLGIGNFKYLSENTQINRVGIPYSELSAHSLVLEIIVGIGVFAATFIFWLLMEILYLIKNLDESNLIFTLAFIAITVNFMFNVSYEIPTMFWLWFASLGLSAKNTT